MTDFRLAPAAIGSLPHDNVDDALALVFENFREIPFWPQLPRRDFRENMYIQYSENLPCRVLDEAGQRLYFDTGRLADEAEEFYRNYLDENLDYFALGREYAAGFYGFCERIKDSGSGSFTALKGHITGPVSFGLALTDQNKKPLLYDDAMFDIIVKGLAKKAAWQARELKKLAGEKETVIFIDEPYLTSFGSGFVSLSREKAVNALREVLDGLDCVCGVHCCGNTDWSLFTEAGFQVVSFDAYDYAENVALYADEIGSFLGKGGVLAWGIVPTSGDGLETLAGLDADVLLEKLEKCFGLFEKRGLKREVLFKQGLITPNCGTGSLALQQAEQVFRLTRKVSKLARERFGLLR